ncbi:Small auxin-up RNA protein [Dioscorea alata]|uniref:Small auxin-up RNA protein n=1 Tax=Dioscorea alata TaxID=55571 RepID=A0ACB7V6Y6_DIOAL|nr:Small auxin-up RNA protein [Dioscorea alata]
MGVHFLRVTLNKKRALADVPKGHFVVYVGEAEKRYVIPISYLNHPLFRKLLHRAEEEFGFSHGMSGIIVPSSEQAFQSHASAKEITLSSFMCKLKRRSCI